MMQKKQIIATKINGCEQCDHEPISNHIGIFAVGFELWSVNFHAVLTNLMRIEKYI